MARYKGRLSAKSIERDFPNIVEMAVPGGGLRRKADEIAAWYRERGLDCKYGRGDHREAVWYVHWCFLKREDAEEFVSQFGGQLLGPELLSRRPAKRSRG